MELKLFVATKALIERDGKILVVKESSAYKDGTNAGKCDVIGGASLQVSAWKKL